MKAIEILEWICNISIEGENLYLIDIPSEEDDLDEWFIMQFGAAPETKVESGKYLYYYSGDESEVFLNSKYIKPDAVIHLEDDEETIYLYKLED